MQWIAISNWKMPYRLRTYTDIRIVQVELLPVSLVSVEEEPTVQAKQHSATCVDPVACSHPPRSGASGTKRSISVRSKSSPPSLPTQLPINNLLQAIRNRFRPSSLFRPRPPPRPRSPNLHRPRSPPRHQLRSVRLRSHLPHLRRTRPPQDHRRRSRHQQGEELPQAARRQG